MRVNVAIPGKSIVLGLDGVEEFERLRHALHAAHLVLAGVGRMAPEDPDATALLDLAAKLDVMQTDFVPAPAAQGSEG